MTLCHRLLRDQALTVEDHMRKAMGSAVSDPDMAYFYIDKAIATLQEMRSEIYKANRRSGVPTSD